MTAVQTCRRISRSRATVAAGAAKNSKMCQCHVVDVVDAVAAPNDYQCRPSLSHGTEECSGVEKSETKLLTVAKHKFVEALPAVR